jgi:hypothetical protein
MDKVTLDGKVYERSALVAKRFGYTADYMGQLSRAEKVDAKLVGRSWYVHAPSVEAYQKGLDEEPETTPSSSSDGSLSVTSDDKSYRVATHTGRDEKTSFSNTSRKNETIETSNRPDDTNEKKVPVPGKTSSATATAHRSESTSSSTAKSRSRKVKSRFSYVSPNDVAKPHNWQRIAYHHDDGDLQPHPSTPEAKNEVAPVHEIGKRLKVHSDTENFSLVASAVPEVSLRGEVHISSVDDTDTEALSDYYEAATDSLRQSLRETPSQKRPPATASISRYESDAAADTPVPPSFAWLRVLGRVLWGVVFLALFVVILGVLLNNRVAYEQGGDYSSSLGVDFGVFSSN